MLHEVRSSTIVQREHVLSREVYPLDFTTPSHFSFQIGHIGPRALQRQRVGIGREMVVAVFSALCYLKTMAHS
jgi:hypothetical protein